MTVGSRAMPSSPKWYTTASTLTRTQLPNRLNWMGLNLTLYTWGRFIKSVSISISSLKRCGVAPPVLSTLSGPIT